jgi:hypothetical protein
MAKRPGPVFVYEWLVASRRWQHFALRSLFATALLIALGMAWHSAIGFRAGWTIEAQAELARAVYTAIAGT